VEANARALPDRSRAEKRGPVDAAADTLGGASNV